MTDTGIKKTRSTSLKGVGLSVMTIGVIAALLNASGFPLFLLFFIAALSFFIWKAFSSDNRNESRAVFEFYLAANAILREDGRRWFGFEILETIRCGETIVRNMSIAPPLVHFALGSLYQKVGDHESAVKSFCNISESASADESAIIFPTRELRDYARTLRKIEQSPSEAPLTYAAVRSLERARNNHVRARLDFSLAQLENAPTYHEHRGRTLQSVVERDGGPDLHAADEDIALAASDDPTGSQTRAGKVPENGDSAAHTNETRSDRKTISEVLHDIYEEQIQ